MVEDASTAVLRGAVDKIESNLAQKERIRGVSKELEILKQAIKGGDGAKAEKSWKRLSLLADKAGFGPNSELRQMLSQVPVQGSRKKRDANGRRYTENFDKFSGLSKGEKTKWDDFFKSFGRVVDAESQSASDIGQKLQFELTQANNIFNRTVKTRSDLAAKDDRTKNGIIGNLKG